MYYRHLGGLAADDFVEACDRIIYGDDWFPTIARIRAVSAECALERHRTALAITIQRDLVCPYCHGARWVRLGGYDPERMQSGDPGSRVQPCPKCTTVGMHDETKEAWVISQEGGVPNENAGKDIDLSRTTWSVPKMPDGRVDLEAMYRESRILRNLDPDVDARPRQVGSWKTIGGVREQDRVVRETVTVGATDD